MSASLDEPIQLHTWKTAWREHAQKLITDLSDTLDVGDRIEHIGSTAVEGMRAKPIIDLMIGALNAEEVEVLAKKLIIRGFDDLGEAGVPGRRALRLRKSEEVNIAIVRFGGEHWTNNIALRDFLRSHPEERDEYSTLKEDIVASGATQLLDYSDQKAEFLRNLLRKALKIRA